jgi:uncharacterized protein YigA (DUF484 family)
MPVLVEALKEQQQQVETQAQQLKRVAAENAELKAQLAALTQALCALNPQADVCVTPQLAGKTKAETKAPQR